MRPGVFSRRSYMECVGKLPILDNWTVLGSTAAVEALATATDDRSDKQSHATKIESRRPNTIKISTFNSVNKK